MDLSKGTPQQIIEFKDNWKPHAYTISVPENIDWKCKVWCQRNLERWEWAMEAWTDEKHHTFLFLHEEDYIEFQNTLVNNFRIY